MASSQLLLLQPSSSSGVLLSSMSGLPRLLQSQLLLAACGQQPLRCTAGASGQSLLQQQHSIHTAATAEAPETNSAAAGDASSGSSSSKRMEKRRQQQYERRLHAYNARLPRAQKYGPMLRAHDRQAFEQMRLVVGYYDLPQNVNKPRPAAPTHVILNNLQTLVFTRDVDPYYKLALLSYKSKLENMEVLQSLSKTRSFLSQLSAPPDFVPAHLEQLTAAALHHHHQQQQQQQAEGDSSSSNSSSRGDAADAAPAASQEGSAAADSANASDSSSSSSGSGEGSSSGSSASAS